MGEVQPNPHLRDTRMTEETTYDTVTALSEADATGEIAEIFADIRQTMEIPLLTSIWRILVDFECGLSTTWNAVKPLYATQQPEAALARLRHDAEFPMLEAILPTELRDADVSGEELPAIKAIVAAYNRSNSLNLLTQTAIVIEPSEKYAAYQQTPPAEQFPALPALPTRDEIDDQVWKTVLKVNDYGTSEDDRGLATFYRHLAHWPGLLELMDSKLAPTRDSGSIERCAKSVFAVIREEGARMAHLRDDRQVAAIPQDAFDKVATYVSTPHTVTRIVSIGTGIGRWLDTADR
jgi:hypothetical protein